MKTKNSTLRARSAFSMIILLITAGSCYTQGSETRTLFGPDVKISTVWAPEISINSIQGKTGVLVGGYAGAMINGHILAGVAGGVNLTHPEVNYGYFGGFGQYIVSPESRVHLSAQLLIGWGSTKDYEDEKEGVMDNFWNISGELFFIKEPGINVEFNLTERVTLVSGVSYRYVTGIDPKNEHISRTMVSNKDMSGVNVNIGLRIK